MIKCPNCARDNEPDAKICIYCGAPLVDVVSSGAATRSLGDTDYEDVVSKLGPAKFGHRMNLVIGVGKDARTLSFASNEIESLVIGREDPDTGERPEIDLTDFGAVEKGVSRRHAAIIRKDDSLQIVDRDSPNGTFLNGQRLVANQSRVLRDGDDIRLGHLVIRINFSKNPPSS